MMWLDIHFLKVLRAMDGLPNSYSTPAKAQRVVNHNHAF